MMARRRAFTLMEVIVAIGLLGAIVWMMGTYLAEVGRVRERLLRAVNQSVVCTTLLERMEADLLATMVGDAPKRSGVRGDRASLTVVSRGMPPLAGSGGGAGKLVDLRWTALRFVAESHALESATGAGLPPEAPAWRVAGSGLRHVRFRYYNGRQWRDRFESAAAGRLPLAVEVAIWFERGADAEEVHVDEPPDAPDRVRVIAIPDAAPQPGAGEVDDA
jgi:type II secretory pathway component PulJ